MMMGSITSMKGYTMKKIAIEEHVLPEEYIKYLFTRNEYPKRDYVEKDGKKFIRDWWSPTTYKLMDPDKPDMDRISIGAESSNLACCGTRSSPVPLLP